MSEKEKERQMKRKEKVKRKKKERAELLAREGEAGLSSFEKRMLGLIAKHKGR